MAENELSALIKTLTQIQIEFVAARLSTKSDKAAAEAIGISPTTAYQWPNKGDVNHVIQLATLSSFEIARERLSRLALKAVGVLDKEMDGDKPLPPACEVLDRAGLAAKGQLDVTIDVGLTDEERIARLATIFDAARTRRDRSTDQE